MRIIISNVIQIFEPTQKIVDYCKSQLVVKNPEYNKKIQMGFFTGKTPRLIHLYSIEQVGLEKCVCLPIGCFDDIYKLYPDRSLYTDYSVSVKRNIQSSIVLRDYQKPCLEGLKTAFNGIFLLPCGLGKTECALACAHHLQQHTLFIAHTKDLINQAKSRCEGKMKCTTSVISDGKVDTSGDIVFATVQTLYKNLDKIPQDEFGLVVCDECHHLACNANTVAMFRTSIDHFASRYKLGLTATLHRADGLEMCIPKLLGEPIYEIIEEGENYVGVLRGKRVIEFPKSQFQVPAKVHFVKTNYKLYNDKIKHYRDVFDKNGMTLNFSKLINDISLDKERNDLIVRIAKECCAGSTIILSDRVEQLKYLETVIPNSIEIDGGTKKKDREQALEDVKGGKYKVLLASYKLAKEGLDCKILTNVIFATPVKDQAVVIQSVGRAQRPYEKKELAHVFDLVDDVSMLKRFLQKRTSVYRKKDWL